MYSKDIERKVAIKYFHVLEEDVEDISLVELAKKAKLKYEDVLIFFPYNHIINRQKFIKLFINYIDDITLIKLSDEIKNEDLHLFEKVLEGIILRFEEIIKFKKSIKKISFSLNSKLINFKTLFFDNHLFMIRLLRLCNDQDNFVKLNLKAGILSSMYFKILLYFFNTDNPELDKIISKVDNDLKKIFEFKPIF